MIINEEALKDRIDNLGAFNGLKLVLVELQPQPNPVEAVLSVQFFNANRVAAIRSAVNANPGLAKVIFPLSGGSRLPAGDQAGQVQVTAVAAGPDSSTLVLTVRPIGDYSTYTLEVVFDHMDPLLSEIQFRFRPGCFNNCPPDWQAPSAPRQDPPIDYLAKDYDSFRHVLMSWMINRVPNWQPTSEADLDQVLIDLFSAVGDELSDFQDRVMNEAYLLTARKRVSLARHARLVDYHIHQGNQASTWLSLQAGAAAMLGKGFQAASGDLADPTAVVFVTREPAQLDPRLNAMSLYTWSDAIPALEAGSTQADLELSVPGKAAADDVRDLIRSGKISLLLIQEHLNPLTGGAPGTDPSHRQLLHLLPGNAGAESLLDPLTGRWFVRVHWDERDRLQRNYCFVVDCLAGKVRDVSQFHSNLVEAYHGRPQAVTFRDPDDPLLAVAERHYERNARGAVLCRLGNDLLAYQNTPPGGEIPPHSTLEVSVEIDGTLEPWEEVINLVHSDENAAHFVVETDELGRSLLRTGDGVNGMLLQPGASVHCSYQVGRGLDGNIGLDTLVNFDPLLFPMVQACSNPFDAVDGRDPEPEELIMRRAPEAYRFRQLRAVTLQDYVDRAEALPGVARASAAYLWTGSWRTVRITIDPAGTTALSDALRQQVARQLEAVRLIGEDLEIRPPQFVPLEIQVAVCIGDGYWPEDVRFVLEQEFSEGYTADGRLAFFHPDLWTFGMPLYASQILGRLQAVQGVDHAIRVKMKRLFQAANGLQDKIEVRQNEIIRVKNDPDQLENGYIQFDLQGGRS